MIPQWRFRPETRSLYQTLKKSINILIVRSGKETAENTGIYSCSGPSPCVLAKIPSANVYMKVLIRIDVNEAHSISHIRKVA